MMFPLRKYYHFLLLAFAHVNFLNLFYIYMLLFGLHRLYHKAKEFFKVKAASLGDEKNDEDNSSGEIVDSGDDNEPQQAIKKKKVGFRERKIIEYENRIRHYSTP